MYICTLKIYNIIFIIDTYTIKNRYTFKSNVNLNIRDKLLNC